MTGGIRAFAAAKRGQTELLGFAVVVMLIAVGMLFVIGFYVTTPSVSTQASYQQTLVATSMNDALLETTTTCRQLTVRELLQRCLDDNVAPICPGSDISTLGESTTACDYIAPFIEHRLTATLDKWGYDYEYSVRAGSIKAAPFLIKTNRANRVGCEQIRSPLAVSGASQPIIIFLDLYSCKSKR